jgi:two-component system heavy metal sensor histidine kinase CusS
MSSKPAADRARRPWSIALRLTVWYTAAAFALVAVAIGYLYWSMVRNMDHEDDEYLSDKIRDVQRVLRDRPGDEPALRQEVLTGGDRDPGRLQVRVHRGSGTSLETPGMDRAVPPEAFPAVGGSAERSDDFRGPDGRLFRLRAGEASPGVFVQVALDRTHDEELLGGYLRQTAYVLGATLLAAAVGGYQIARRGIRPIADVTATARRIRPTHMNERIATAGLPSEVRELAATFNHMLDRLEDAFHRLRQFSADIAHELRTPVNNLQGSVEVALGRPRTTEEYREVLASNLEECGRLTRLIDSLLFLARAADPRTELTTTPLDASAELIAVREFFEPAASEAGVRLQVESDPKVVVRAARQLLHRAIGNLVANALAHTPAGGSVTLFAAAEAGHVRLGVRDTGPGIPAEHLPYVFDRFYQADPARSTGRVGLGLAIVKGIAELHGGSASATASPGGGTTVTLTFPARTG